MDYICGVTTQALDDPSLEDRLLISTDVHCLQRFDIRNQRLSLPSVLIKVARSCLMMKRYAVNIRVLRVCYKYCLFLKTRT